MYGDNVHFLNARFPGNVPLLQNASKMMYDSFIVFYRHDFFVFLCFCALGCA